jgi:predicted phage-related endonuclease
MNFTYMLDREFKGERNYIGASDVPTISLYNLAYGNTPLKLYKEKLGEIEHFEGNEPTEMGKHLEPLILKLALEKLGRKSDRWYQSRIKGENKHHMYHSWTEGRYNDYIVAHADLYIDNIDTIIEAKNTGYFAAKRRDIKGIRGFYSDGFDKDDFSGNGVPDRVYIQVQTQMMCYKAKQAYVAVLIEGRQHILYGPIKANLKVQESILAVCEKFWNCVQEKKEPQPHTWDDIILLNPELQKDKKIMIMKDGDIYNSLMLLKDRKEKLSEKAKKIENELKDIKNAVGLIIAENALVEDSEGQKLVSAYEVTRETIKLKELKTEEIKIYAKLKDKGYINLSTSRQLRY